MYTKGPWEIDDEEIFGNRIIEGDYIGYDIICRIPTECNPKELLTDENKANARLIAAAPELLDACKAAFNLIKESGFTSGLTEDVFDSTLSQLEKAIEKAEGRY